MSGHCADCTAKQAHIERLRTWNLEKVNEITELTRTVNQLQRHLANKDWEIRLLKAPTICTDYQPNGPYTDD